MRIKTCDEVLNKLLEIGDSVDNPADIDVYWKFTDKANLEYARKRNVSEYITFAGLGKVNNKRWPTGAREGSKNAERGAYTPKSLASLCKFLEREFKDCGDCLFVSGDGRALNDIVVENGKVVLVFGRATGCFTRESVENEKTEMKANGKEVFTLQIERMDEYGEYEVVDEMKYAKTYYSFDDAVEDGKKAYDEYSAIEDTPVSVSIMGGEYEMPNGDIYGEPECLETIRAKNRDKFDEST